MLGKLLTWLVAVRDRASWVTQTLSRTAFRLGHTSWFLEPPHRLRKYAPDWDHHCFDATANSRSSATNRFQYFRQPLTTLVFSATEDSVASAISAISTKPSAWESELVMEALGDSEALVVSEVMGRGWASAALETHLVPISTTSIRLARGTSIEVLLVTSEEAWEWACTGCMGWVGSEGWEDLALSEERCLYDLVQCN